MSDRPLLNEEPVSNKPSARVHGPTAKFWELHSISPEKTPAGSNEAPKTPTELAKRVQKEREKARLEEMSLKLKDPRIARNPPDPKPKPFTKKIVTLKPLHNVDD